MQRWFALKLLSLGLLSHCYYDNVPPTPEELRQYRPFLAVRVVGLNHLERLLLRYREDFTLWQTFPAVLVVTPGGELYFSYQFSVNTQQVEIELVIDQNNNQLAEANEPTYTSPPLSFSAAQDRLVLSLHRNDFVP